MIKEGEVVAKSLLKIMQHCYNNIRVPHYSKPDIVITDEDIVFLLTMVDTSCHESALEDVHRIDNSFFLEGIMWPVKGT